MLGNIYIYILICNSKMWGKEGTIEKLLEKIISVQLYHHHQPLQCHAYPFPIFRPYDTGQYGLLKNIKYYFEN